MVSLIPSNNSHHLTTRRTSKKNEAWTLETFLLFFNWSAPRSSPIRPRGRPTLGRARSRNAFHAPIAGFCQPRWVVEKQARVLSCKSCFSSSQPEQLPLLFPFSTFLNRTPKASLSVSLDLNSSIPSPLKLPNQIQMPSRSFSSLPIRKNFPTEIGPKPWRWIWSRTWCFRKVGTGSRMGMISGKVGCSKRTWKWGRNRLPKEAVPPRVWTWSMEVWHKKGWTSKKEGPVSAEERRGISSWTSSPSISAPKMSNY